MERTREGGALWVPPGRSAALVGPRAGAGPGCGTGGRGEDSGSQSLPLRKVCGGRPGGTSAGRRRPESESESEGSVCCRRLGARPPACRARGAGRTRRTRRCVAGTVLAGAALEPSAPRAVGGAAGEEGPSEPGEGPAGGGAGAGCGVRARAALLLLPKSAVGPSWRGGVCDSCSRGATPGSRGATPELEAAAGSPWARLQDGFG